MPVVPTRNLRTGSGLSRPSRREWFANHILAGNPAGNAESMRGWSEEFIGG